jgi:hypothetical protein
MPAAPTACTPTRAPVVLQGQPRPRCATGKRDQITRRGPHAAAEAARARREILERKDRGQIRPTRGVLTMNELLHFVPRGLNADERLARKTRHGYRVVADTYLRGLVGALRVGDVTPEVILAWQQRRHARRRQGARAEHDPARPGARGGRVQARRRESHRRGQPARTDEAAEGTTSLGAEALDARTGAGVPCSPCRRQATRRTRCARSSWAPGFVSASWSRFAATTS